MLETQELDVLHSRLAKFIDEAKERSFNSHRTLPDSSLTTVSNFEFSLVAFDSILLVSHDLNMDYSENDFIFSCIELMKLGAPYGFHLRGAIDVDNVLYDREREIILSKAQPRLLQLEKMQDWMGCAVTNRAWNVVWEKLFGNREFSVNMPIIPYNLPLKNNLSAKGIADFCLNWVVTNPTVSTLEIMNFLEGIKKENTTVFINFLTNNPNFRQYLNPPAIPVYEFRYIATRLSASFLFLNEHGVAVDPQSPLQVTVAEGNDKGVTISFSGKK